MTGARKRRGNDLGEYYLRRDCRACHSLRVRPFLDLGVQPLAGDFRLEEEVGTEPRYPLRVSFCPDCRLVQVLDVVSRDVIFSDYRYLSSVTSTLRSHFIELADELKRRLAPFKDPLVVEVGCNDGVLLRPLKEQGIRTVGVEPAKNVAEVACRSGLQVVNRFFTQDVAEGIKREYGAASAVTGSNVFAHIDDLDEAIRAASFLLRNDGLFLMEVHYLPVLLRGLQYDFFYHEHLCYYSILAIQRLLGRHGLQVFDVFPTAIHGGSVRVYALRSDSPVPQSPRLKRMLQSERAMRLTSAATYSRFGARVRGHARRLVSLLDRSRAKGKRLAGYGAPGRGNTLLCYAGIDKSRLPYLVDASPSRYGRFTPGTHIPIFPTDHFRSDPPDEALVLAWTYLPEIVAKERWYLEEGGKFIVPLPRLKTVDRSHIPSII